MERLHGERRSGACSAQTFRDCLLRRVSERCKGSIVAGLRTVRLAGNDSNRSLLVLSLMLSISLSLISGCSRSSAQLDDDDAEQPAFEFERLQAMPDLAPEPEKPNTSSSVQGQNQQLSDLVNSAKPGHWIAARQQILATDADFQGEMRSLVLSSGQPARTETSDHYLVVERPLVLQAGTPKDLELIFYIPRRLDVDSRSVLLEHTLRDRLGRTVGQNSGSVSLLEPYQFFTVVLANTPDEYSFLPTMRSHLTLVGANRVSLDQVILADCRSEIPLPSDIFGWTAISTIIWHDLEPDRLDPGQQQAMLDWLYFGGQLIVSGPEGVDRLRGSFLGPVLAARSTGSRQLSQADLDSLNEFWALPMSADQPAKHWRLVEGGAILGADLELVDDARFVPNCGELLADRRLGRGRVVVSAFSLTEKSWRIWPSIDNFFHNAIYLRPRREYNQSSLFGIVEPRVKLVDYSSRELNPLLYSKLRFFTHDWRDSAIEPWSTEQPSSETSVPSVQTPVSEGSIVMDSRQVWDEGPYTDSIKSGVAGWNDMGAASQVARRILSESSGLEPPSRQFVLTAVGIYLLVLVPLNWLVFRVLNRVEWAWIAAPVIAIVTSIAVVRAARLDIGFARSQSELVVVEVPSGYERAHVTRYSNLYTSLSTQFEVDFESSVARGQPWGSRTDETRFTADREVVLNREGALRLEGFRIASNTAGLLHSEEFMGIGGSFRWGPETTSSATSNESRSSISGDLLNGTNLKVGMCAVLHRDTEGNWWGTQVQSLEPNRILRVELQPLPDEQAWDGLWAGSSNTDYLGSELLPVLNNVDSDADGSLTRDDIRLYPEAESNWLDAFDRVLVKTQSTGNGKLDESHWPLLCREIASSRFSCGGLIELWMSVAHRSQSGTFLIGTVDDLEATCRITPLPSQREQRAVLIAELLPVELPEPTSDVNLPPIPTNEFESRDPEGLDSEEQDDEQELDF